jgi:hypothetical protein
VLSLFTKGFPTACLLSNQHVVVHQKALKAMHTLFDMEVSTRITVECMFGSSPCCCSCETNSLAQCAWHCCMAWHLMAMVSGQS